MHVSMRCSARAVIESGATRQRTSDASCYSFPSFFEDTNAGHESIAMLK